MSRIGKLPVKLPNGVAVSYDATTGTVKVKGPKGELFQVVDRRISIDITPEVVVLKRDSDEKQSKAMHGLYRSLVNNMVKGVSDGFTVQQELVGVGYKAEAKGQILELSLGYSHDIHIQLPSEIKVEVKQERKMNPIITMTCADKQLLGHVAAKIRSMRKPEPYKGKGIKFVGEELRRKAGKSAASK